MSTLGDKKGPRASSRPRASEGPEGVTLWAVGHCGGLSTQLRAALWGAVRGGWLTGTKDSVLVVRTGGHPLWDPSHRPLLPGCHSFPTKSTSDGTPVTPATHPMGSQALVM